MSQPGRGPATSLPSLRLLRMTAFGTSRCRPPRCHVAAVSSDRGKNHDPAGTEAASHWSVTPCSPPSRPGRCAVGAGAPSLDRRCARCPGDGWPGQENGASTEQKNRGQAKKSLQSGRRLKNEGRDKQAEQAAGKPTGGPFVAVQHAVVVGEVRDLVQPHHPQCGCDGAPTGHEDRTHHQHHHMVPGRRGERVPEWLHPFSQPAWYIASRCVPHSFIPESIFRGDSPISRLLRIAHVITLDSITQDSTRFSSRHYQRHSWLISLDGILCGSENGQTQAENVKNRPLDHPRWPNKRQRGQIAEDRFWVACPPGHRSAGPQLPTERCGKTNCSNGPRPDCVGIACPPWLPAIPALQKTGR